MKKFFLLFSIFLLGGCSKEINFEVVDMKDNGFHEINVAEWVDDGILYYSGDRLLYDKNDTIVEIADDVISLWRENDDIYYNSDHILYTYNFSTKEKKKMVDKPYVILGKYNDSIISYSGRNIYSIKDTKKIKIFKDGYYLNDAILYNNKVYGIPATNVYEYDLDTLKVNKITNHKHDLSNIFMVGDELYVSTMLYKSKNSDKFNYTYYKVKDKGLVKDFSMNNYSSVGIQKVVRDGVIVFANKDDYVAKGNKLFYINNGKLKTIDKDYYYDVIGIYDNKLLYYKNISYFGTEEENLKTFYFYDGINSTKAFDLDIGYFEDINGYEYENGIVIEVIYESATYLYKYDGKIVQKIEIPDYFFRMEGLDIIDDNAYIIYIDGEESFERLGAIIDLK